MKLSSIFFAVFVLALITMAYLQISGTCEERSGYLVMRVRSFACDVLPWTVTIIGAVSAIAGMFQKEEEDKRLP